MQGEPPGLDGAARLPAGGPEGQRDFRFAQIGRKREFKRLSRAILRRRAGTAKRHHNRLAPGHSRKDQAIRIRRQRLVAAAAQRGAFAPEGRERPEAGGAGALRFGPEFPRRQRTAGFRRAIAIEQDFIAGIQSRCGGQGEKRQKRQVRRAFSAARALQRRQARQVGRTAERHGNRARVSGRGGGARLAIQV